MSGEQILVIVILGVIAGWLGGVLFRSSGAGVFRNIIVAIIGGFIGHWLFKNLGINLSTGFLSYILYAGIGAAVLLVILNLVYGRIR